MHTLECVSMQLLRREDKSSKCVMPIRIIFAFNIDMSFLGLNLSFLETNKNKEKKKKQKQKKRKKQEKEIWEKFYK